VSVYVDAMRASVGRMILCHMLADTSEELHAMADRIGVARKWCQDPGTHREHYDIALSKRAIAIQFGAKSITTREAAAIRHARRAPTTETPDNG
jgi:hypothetical protein